MSPSLSKSLDAVYELQLLVSKKVSMMLEEGLVLCNLRSASTPLGFKITGGQWWLVGIRFENPDAPDLFSDDDRTPLVFEQAYNKKPCGVVAELRGAWKAGSDPVTRQVRMFDLTFVKDPSARLESRADSRSEREGPVQIFFCASAAAGVWLQSAETLPRSLYVDSFAACIVNGKRRFGPAKLRSKSKFGFQVSLSSKQLVQAGKCFVPLRKSRVVDFSARTVNAWGKRMQERECRTDPMYDDSSSDEAGNRSHGRRAVVLHTTIRPWSHDSGAPSAETHRIVFTVEAKCNESHCLSSHFWQCQPGSCSKLARETLAYVSSSEGYDEAAIAEPQEGEVDCFLHTTFEV